MTLFALAETNILLFASPRFSTVASRLSCVYTIFVINFGQMVRFQDSVIQLINRYPNLFLFFIITLSGYCIVSLLGPIEIAVYFRDCVALGNEMCGNVNKPWLIK